MADDRVRFWRAGAASRKPKARKLWRGAALLRSGALSGGPNRVRAVLSPLPFREHRLWPTPSLPSERTNPSSSAPFIANATDPHRPVLGTIHRQSLLYTDPQPAISSVFP